jgi:hypothetical protein
VSQFFTEILFAFYQKKKQIFQMFSVGDRKHLKTLTSLEFPLEFPLEIKTRRVSPLLTL